ncbi:TetR/AcrR family transcriptional regulator [Kineosporia sp. A_224]|uniref:TetR/AcrR family transcriptional regulator n=1 Tax=Kineosporia sp. A_224 TaxID=1962180 RepID=UPI00130472E3|nr:TetR/AcrR family transcriptional regulator [Kineosporia sp. A_224]
MTEAVPPQPQPQPATLRSRRREEVLGAIRAAAGAELEEQGAAALSLRAVARRVGLAPSALYRYFPGRDDLLTDLVVAAFDAQADAVVAAAGRHRDPLAAARAALLEYRAWAVANPARFGLLYGAPVPGYAAPPETIGPGARVGDLVVGLVEQLHAQHRLDAGSLRRRASRLDSGTASELAALARRRGYTLPVGAIALGVDGFVRVHGVTVMEVFGQLRPLTSRAAPYVEQTVDAVLAELVGPAAGPGEGR